MTPWTVARQPPLSMEFSRQEHWSGLPFPPPGGLPNPEIKPGSGCRQIPSPLALPCLHLLECPSAPAPSVHLPKEATLLLPGHPWETASDLEGQDFCATVSIGQTAWAWAFGLPPAWDRQGAGLTPQLLIQGSPRGHRQCLDELGELDPPVLQEREGQAWPRLARARPLLQRVVMDGRQQVPDAQVQSKGGKG